MESAVVASSTRQMSRLGVVPQPDEHR